MHWSYGAQTALAEAEVEYKDEDSPAIFVKFPVDRRRGRGLRLHGHLDHHALDAAGEPRHRRASRASITSSATLPDDEGNVERLVVAKGLLEAFGPKTGLPRAENTLAAETIKGKCLDGAVAPSVPATATRRSSPRPSSPPTPAPARSTSRPATAPTTTSPGRRTTSASSRRSMTTGNSPTRSASPNSSGCIVFEANEPIIELLAGKRRAPRQREIPPQLPALLALQDAHHLPRGPAVLHPHRRHPRDAPWARSTRSSGSRLGPQPHRRHRSSRAPTGASPASAPGACRCRSSTTPRRADPRRAISRARSPTWSTGARHQRLVRKDRRRRWPRARPARRHDPRPRHPRRVDRLRLLARGRPRPPSRTRAPGRPLPRSHRPAPRLVPVSLMLQRHRRGAAPYKTVMTHGFVIDTSGEEDLQVRRRQAGQPRRRALLQQIRRRHRPPLGQPASTGRTTCPSRRRTLQADRRGLPPVPQHPAHPARRTSHDFDPARDAVAPEH